MNHKHEHVVEKAAVEEVPAAVVENESNEELSEMETRDIRISKKAILIFGIVVLVLLLGYYCKGVFFAAMVDGSPITRLEVIRVLEKSSGKQALESLVVQKVLANEAKKRGITVSDDEITAETKRISDSVAAQGATLEAALKQQGVSLEDFSKQLVTQIQVEKMLGDKIAVSPAEVDAYIAAQKYDIPSDKLAAAKVEIAETLKTAKTTKEGKAFVDALRAAARVTVFVAY